MVRNDEIALGRLFAKDNRNIIRSIPREDDFLIWNGVVWQRDDVLQHREVIKDWLDRRIEETQRVLESIAPKLPDGTTANPAYLQAELRIENLAKKRSTNGIRNIRFQIQSDPDLVVRVGDLDTRPDIFAVQNGYIDLKTGELIDPEPGMLMTKQSPIAYDPEAAATLDRIHAAGRFQQFLQEITCGDKELESYLQKVAGYCLTGLVREQQMFILQGNGRNGKDTFTEALMYVMGDYGIKAAPGLLVFQLGNEHPTRVRELAGARLAQSTEFERNQQMAEAFVKELTGNTKLKGRSMHKDFVEFPNTTKHILTTNFPPRIHGEDPAIRRRLVVIPFNLHLEPHEVEVDLPEKLKQEAQVVLAWAIEGAVRYYEEGLNPPQVVLDASRQYHEAMDDFGRYVNQRLEDDPDGFLTFAEIKADYEGWCKAEGVKPESQRTVASRLDAMGHPTVGRRFDNKTVKGREGLRFVGGVQMSSEFVGTVDELLALEVQS